MELIPEWAPNFHPMVVHFPLALLSVAFLFDLLTFFITQKLKPWVRYTTLSLYAVGALSAIGVYFTGQAAADSVFMPAEAQTVLSSHADWALLTVWFYSLYTMSRLLAVWLINKIHHTKVHVVFFTLSLAGLFVLYQTGDHGAQMVFQHGVGVKISNEANEEPITPETEDELSTAFAVQENGDWSWDIDEGALQTLQENFRFLEGSIEEIAAVAKNDRSYRLRFSSEELNQFIVTDEIYQNVQVDYYLDLSDFEGTLTLVNHLQDLNNYDYVSITGEGTVVQGRLADGETEVFETGNADVSDSVFVRTVANGTHFRGYVDKEMVVHGHGDAPMAGRVGFRLDGSGTILIDRISLAQLNNN